MATTHRTSRVNTGNYERKYTGSTYVYGNTVIDIKKALDEAPNEEARKKIIKKPKKAVHLNLGYVMFLTAAFAVLGFVLTGYIRLQTDITSSTRRVAQLESTYLEMKLDNEQEYERIVNSVDLNEVKRVAIEELGMHYATEGQIITYTDTMSDYVRQYSDIEE